MNSLIFFHGGDTMSKAVEKLIDEISVKEKKVEKFSDLLDSLSNTEDKKKLL